MGNESRVWARRVAASCVFGSLVLHGILMLGLPEAMSLKAQPGQSAAVPQAVLIRQLVSRSQTPSLEVVAPDAPSPQAVHAQATLSPPVAASEPSLGAVTDDAPYMPRKQLEQPPRLLGSVDLLWPDDGPPAGHYQDVLSLYIDADGSVRRVRVEGNGMPEQLQEVARAAFLNARFSPGLLNGQPVRSWIRMEVAFDADARVAPKSAKR